MAFQDGALQLLQQVHLNPGLMPIEKAIHKMTRQTAQWLGLDAGSLTEVVLITDPFRKGLTSDKARLRAFNAAFNAANLDVYLTAPGADIATATPTFAAVGYKDAMPASGEDSIEVSGDTYQLRLTEAGSKTVVFDAEVVLEDNADWLLVPVPASLDANHVNVLAVRADAGTPAVEIDGTP